MGDDRGTQLLEERQHLVPHARAEVARVLVGGVERVVDVVAAKRREDVAAPRSDEWAYDVEPSDRARARRKNRQTSRPGAAEKADEEGLRSVVGVVRRRDERRPGVCGRRGERTKA